MIRSHAPADRFRSPVPVSKGDEAALSDLLDAARTAFASLSAQGQAGAIVGRRETLQAPLKSGKAAELARALRDLADASSPFVL